MSVNSTNLTDLDRLGDQLGRLGHKLINLTDLVINSVSLTALMTNLINLTDLDTFELGCDER